MLTPLLFCFWPKEKCMADCVVRAGASVTGEPIRFIGKEMLVKLASDGNG